MKSYNYYVRQNYKKSFYMLDINIIFDAYIKNFTTEKVILRCKAKENNLIKGVRTMGKESITIRLSEEKKAELKKVAEDMGVTLSSVVKIAVSEYLKNNK